MMKIKLILMTIILMTILVGCKEKVNEMDQVNVIEEGQQVSEEKTESDVSEEDSNVEDTNEDTSVVEPLVVEKQVIKIDKSYISADINLEVLGIETYTLLESEKYTDTAIEGQEYVVVYLNINNMTTKDEYFNYNDLESFLDDTSVKTTYLLNNPKDYLTIFNTVLANSEAKGYIVYQVPKDWKELKMLYKGWAETKGITLEVSISADNLKEVEPFVSEYTEP